MHAHGNVRTPCVLLSTAPSTRPAKTPAFLITRVPIKKCWVVPGLLGRSLLNQAPTRKHAHVRAGMKNAHGRVRASTRIASGCKPARAHECAPFHAAMHAVEHACSRVGLRRPDNESLDPRPLEPQPMHGPSVSVTSSIICGHPAQLLQRACSFIPSGPCALEGEVGRGTSGTSRIPQGTGLSIITAADDRKSRDV